jgi:hypothetical protein
MLPGCGSSSKGKPIPNDPANRMVALLGQADSQSAAGTCGGAKAKVREAQTVLQNDVPSSVDKDVRQGLADGMNRMISLIDQECQRPQPTQTQTQTQTTDTTTTPTTTTPTTTTPTTTTPSTTTPTTTTPTTTTPTTTTPTTTTGTSTGNGGTPTSTGGVSAPPSTGGGQG